MSAAAPISLGASYVTQRVEGAAVTDAPATDGTANPSPLDRATEKARIRFAVLSESILAQMSDLQTLIREYGPRLPRNAARTDIDAFDRKVEWLRRAWFCHCAELPTVVKGHLSEG